MKEVTRAEQRGVNVCVCVSSGLAVWNRPQTGKPVVPCRLQISVMSGLDVQGRLARSKIHPEDVGHCVNSAHCGELGASCQHLQVPHRVAVRINAWAAGVSGAHDGFSVCLRKLDSGARFKHMLGWSQPTVAAFLHVKMEIAASFFSHL